MRTIIILVVCCLALSFNGQAQNETWSDNIAEIIYTNCTTCHRPGEIGPFALTNYNEAKAWAASIKFVTNIGYMPPWPPDRDYKHFQGERGLSADEIQKIANWVDEGTPLGNIDNEPELPTFPTGSQIGMPDLILSFEESYMHQGNNADEYRVFVLPTGLSEDKIVKSIELRAGNRKIVHHALISYDVTGTAQQLDEDTPDYGYTSFGGFGDGLDDAFNRQFPGYVPGQKPSFYPDGLGQTLPAGSDLLLQIHYAPIAANEFDSTTVNLFFADESEIVDRMVQNFIITPFTAQGGLLLLPPDEITQSHYFINNIPFDVSIMAIWPHMHLLGRNWEVFGTSKGDTIPLIKINDWDFNWQGVYNYDRFQILPTGSSIHAFATYDNTSDNPSNPNNPPKFVTWGERTTDEMFYLPISFVLYRPGDEDIIFTDSLTSTYNPPPDHSSRLLSPWPNPAREEVNIPYYLQHHIEISLNIYDVKGQLVERLLNNNSAAEGQNIYRHDISKYAVGTYFVELVGDREVKYQMFQKL